MAELNFKSVRFMYHFQYFWTIPNWIHGWGYIFVFQKTGIITKPKQTECKVNSYNKDTEAFCKCECPDLIKQTGDEELHYSS